MYFPDLSRRVALIMVGAASLGLVAASLVLAELLNLHPCPMCIFQRVLYLLLGAFALLAAFVARPAVRWSLVVLAVAAALGGIATASYQTWMQAFPGSIMECGYSEPNLMERLVDWLGTQWELMFLATGLCSSKEWTFLGLSMANWSIACFLGLGGALIWAMRRPA